MPCMFIYILHSNCCLRKKKNTTIISKLQKGQCKNSGCQPIRCIAKWDYNTGGFINQDSGGYRSRASPTFRCYSQHLLEEICRKYNAVIWSGGLHSCARVDANIVWRPSVLYTTWANTFFPGATADFWRSVRLSAIQLIADELTSDDRFFQTRCIVLYHAHTARPWIPMNGPFCFFFPGEESSLSVCPGWFSFLLMYCFRS